jgi:hypothetical protein
VVLVALDRLRASLRSVRGRAPPVRLYLFAGFFVTAATTSRFSIAPALDGNPWASRGLGGAGGRLIAALLIAAASVSHGARGERTHAVASMVGLVSSSYVLGRSARARPALP